MAAKGKESAFFGRYAPKSTVRIGRENSERRIFLRMTSKLRQKLFKKIIQIIHIKLKK